MIARPSGLKGGPNFSNIVKGRLEHKIGLLSRGSVTLNRVIMLTNARKAKLKKEKNLNFENAKAIVLVVVRPNFI